MDDVAAAEDENGDQQSVEILSVREHLALDVDRADLASFNGIGYDIGPMGDEVAIQSMCAAA